MLAAANMLAINPTGPKEIIVYVVLGIIIVGALIWYAVSRGRTRS